MRIVHVLTFLDSKRSYGGPATVALTLAEEQAKQGHEPYLFSLSDEDPVQISGFPENVTKRIFRIRKGNGRRKFSAFLSLKSFYWLYKNRNDFDVFHLHFSRDLFQVIAALVITSTSAKIILQPHGMITNAVSKRKPYQAIYDFLFIKPALRRANCVTALQEEEKNALIKAFGCANIAILTNGIKFEEFQDNVPRDHNLVVFVSRLHPQKDPLIFLKVAERMLSKGTSVKFQIAGPDGGLEEEVRSQIELTNSHQFKFLGSLANQEVRSLFRRAGVLVLPSKDDPYPMIILEAASCGLQVILSASSALAPTIIENKLGIICEPTVKNLEQSILSSISHPFDSAQIRLAASKIFNISSVVKSLTEIYLQSHNFQPLK